MGALSLVQALRNAAHFGLLMEKTTRSVTAALRMAGVTTSSSPGASWCLWQPAKPLHMLYPHTSFSSLSRDKVIFYSFPEILHIQGSRWDPLLGIAGSRAGSLLLVQFSMTTLGTTSFLGAGHCSDSW